jgi:hypothetical protein
MLVGHRDRAPGVVMVSKQLTWLLLVLQLAPALRLRPLPFSFLWTCNIMCCCCCCCRYALTCCSWFAKDFPRLLAAKAAHSWDPYDVEELRGKTLGVVGYGDIGR